MNKLEMAHEYLKVLLTQNTSRTVGEAVETAYALADAMQTEADKRNNKETCDKNIGLDSSVLKPSNSMELEWQPDTYPEYEHGRDYPSDAWVTFNGEARLAVSIKEDSLRKRPQ